jgi:hypothetical protein
MSFHGSDANPEAFRDSVIGLALRKQDQNLFFPES